MISRKDFLFCEYTRAILASKLEVHFFALFVLFIFSIFSFIGALDVQMSVGLSVCLSVDTLLFKVFYGILWCIMMYYDVLWCTMMYYDVLWWIMMYYDVLLSSFPFCFFVDTFDFLSLLWYIMIYYDVLWCVMMYYDKLWSIMMHYDIFMINYAFYVDGANDRFNR